MPPHRKPDAPGILIVDDEAFVRNLLANGLRAHGFMVWLAAGGDEAMELYQRHSDQISLVLLDVRMPGLDGPQTLARLQRIKPAIRCCFMSGYTGKYAPEELLALGAERILEKPFDLGKLVLLLRQLVASTEPTALNIFLIEHTASECLFSREI